MNKKKTKKISDAEYKYGSGEVLSMLENINDGIGVLADGQKVLENRMDGLENKMDGLENRMDGLENKVDGLENKVDGLENKIENLQSDVTEIKYKLNRKVDYDEFEKLEKRVLKLEDSRQKV